MPRKKSTSRVQVLQHLWQSRAWVVLLISTLLLYLLWNVISPQSPLQTSTLKTTFDRLSSTTVDVVIPEAGLLRINTGPSSFLDDAEVFGIVLQSSEAQFTNDPPFQVSSAYETIFNLIDPDNPAEVQLALVFPQGRFSNQEGTLAELPFTTNTEGQFEVKGIYFGNLPKNGFPPYQDFKIYLESSNILFDETGASKAVVTPTTGTQPTPQNPACADGFDNDGDGLTDHPDDLGCDGPNDTDETDPEGPKPIRLDIPGQYIKTIQTPDLKTEYLAILPPAQEQLRYEFDFEAQGGAGNFTYGVRGKNPNSNGVYPLENSGLVLRESGRLEGDPSNLKGGNYRYQFFITDGNDVFNFAVQIAVHDTLGNPVGLEIESSVEGGEHTCYVDQVCEAFFRTTKGIPPYRYSFTGESPTGDSFIQVNAGEAFYRFIPTAAQQGTFQVSIAVFDNAKREVQEGEETIETNNTATFDYTLVIEGPEIESTFRFSAERNCEFLDLSAVEPTYEFFQFTCRNGIIEGTDGVIREFDGLNRAEASKITSLIVADEDVVDQTFEPFVELPASTVVNYNDVTVGDWYADFVYYLFQQGIIVDNNIYRPADTLNNAEAMKLVIESYASLNLELLNDLEDITVFDEWYEPYQTVASYVDATIAYLDPAEPAARGLIAELLYKIYRAYPIDKFR